MWQYNYDYLCHSSHKYIVKTYKNGRWQYTYPQDLKGHKGTSEQKRLGVMTSDQKRKLLIQKQNTQNAKDRTYALRNQSNIAKAAKQAEEERRQAGTNQNTTDISKASKNLTPQPSKSNLSSRQQTAVNKAVAKSIAYINKTYGTNYGPEAATAAEKERVRRAVEASKNRPAKDQNSREAAIAKSVDATKTATQLANAKKQEAERRRASNTAERSQSARDRAITKSSQPFDAKKNQHMDALAERAFQKIRSKSVDFDIPNAYINDKGQTAYFTAEERREIALKIFKKFVDDDQTSVSEIRRAKNYIMKNFGVSENLLDTLQENYK